MWDRVVLKNIDGISKVELILGFIPEEVGDLWQSVAPLLSWQDSLRLDIIPFKLNIVRYCQRDQAVRLVVREFLIVEPNTDFVGAEIFNFSSFEGERLASCRVAQAFEHFFLSAFFQ